MGKKIQPYHLTGSFVDDVLGQNHICVFTNKGRLTTLTDAVAESATSGRRRAALWPFLPLSRGKTEAIAYELYGKKTTHYQNFGRKRK